MVDPKALTNSEILEAFSVVGQYSFRLKRLSAEEIQVKIWQSAEDVGGNRYSYTISHYVYGPKQAGPYVSSATYGPSEEATLQLAVQHFMLFLPPGEIQPDWLVRNEDF